VRYAVAKPHRPSEEQWLAAQQGTRLALERRETVYAGWIWCVADSGAGGWVPEEWVSIAGDTCTLLRDYDALELPVEPGDMVEVEFTESSWAFVQDERGRQGWVPLECLEPLEGAPA